MLSDLKAREATARFATVSRHYQERLVDEGAFLTAHAEFLAHDVPSHVENPEEESVRVASDDGGDRWRVHGFEPKSSYDPRGPDGLGMNRLALHALTPLRRCRLKPETGIAAWEAHNRPAHWHLSWGSFGLCSGSDCAKCGVASPRADVMDVREGIARQDESGRVWLLDNHHEGWGAFGFCFSSWHGLLSRLTLVVTGWDIDSTGIYFRLTRPN